MPLPAELKPMIDADAVRSLFGGISRVTLRRMVQEGRLPEPFRTGAGNRARRLWRVEDLQAALAAGQPDRAA
jgi:hypothetical protein